MREGVSNLVRRRFLTYSVPAESVDAAVPKLSHIRWDVASTLARIRCVAAPLDGAERLEAISGHVRPGSRLVSTGTNCPRRGRAHEGLRHALHVDFKPAGRADCFERRALRRVLTLRSFGSVSRRPYLASIIDLPLPLT